MRYAWTVLAQKGSRTWYSGGYHVPEEGGVIPDIDSILRYAMDQASADSVQMIFLHQTVDAQEPAKTDAPTEADLKLGRGES